MKYRPELDGLRGVAILLVVACHAGWLPGGSAGVDVFFVLSGYLITSIVKDEIEAKTFTLRSFWIRRARRLLPALFAMLAAYLIAAPFLFPWAAADRWSDTLSVAFYMGDFLAWTRRLSPLAHTWSLAIEEHFYLLWPLLLPWLIRRRDPLLWLAFAWFVVTIARIDVMTATAPDWTSAYFTPLHSTGLLLGACVALSQYRLPPWAAFVGTGLIAVVAGSGFDQGNASRAGITLAEIGTSLLLLGLDQPSKVRTALEWNVIRGVGLISYSAYLWNYPLSQLDDPMIGVGLTFAAAGLSYSTVEALFRRRSKSPAVVIAGELREPA